MEEHPSYELEFERRGWRRLLPWFRTVPGMCAIAALIVLLIGIWQAPAIYRAAKVWRAERLIAQAAQAEKMGDEAAEMRHLRKAFTLLPAHALTWRALAHYHERRGEGAALVAYEQLLRADKSTVEDVVRACRHAALRAPQLSGRTILELAERKEGARDLPAVQSLRARILAATNSWDNALALAEKSAQGIGAEAPEKLVFAILLLQAADRAPVAQRAPLAQRAISLLAELAVRTDDSAVEALSALISLARQPAAAQLLAGHDVNAWVAAAERHPQASARLRVLAWNLQLLGQKDNADTFFASFLAKWRDAPLPQRLEAARWLNQNNRPKLSLELSRGEKDVSEEWFLVFLDALAATGDWASVIEHLDAKTGQAAAMSGALRALFRFRAQKELRQPVDGEEAWRDIHIRLQGEPVATQIYIAQYAEKTGDVKHAVTIYRRVLDEGMNAGSFERSVPREAKLICYTGIIRHTPPEAPVAEVLPLLESMTAEFPEFDEARNDMIYLSLLVGKPTPAMRDDITRLLQRAGSMLAYRTTAALLELRSGNAAAADKLYDGWKIDWDTAADRFKVVRAAVLKAVGKSADAEALLARVNKEKLRPEEAALLR